MILITGPTGTVGKDLLTALQSTPLRAMVRNPAKAAALASPTVQLVQGDFDKPESFPAALAGISKIFLLTNPDPLTLAREKAFLDAAKTAAGGGVQHIVRLSAMGATPDATTPILQLHGQADAQLQSSGIPFTILRPNIFYQNMLWAAEPIKHIGKFFHLAGGVTMSMIDTRDIADAAAKILTTPTHAGKTYTLTGPASISYQDIAATLTTVLGKPIQFVQVPAAAQRQRFLQTGMPPAAVDAIISLFEYFAAGKASALHPDFTQVMQKPPRTFQQFAQDFAPAFK